jgi:Right handed beta helix region
LLVLAGGAPRASADYAPGPNDVVGVGSAALQYLLDFAANGDADGDSGYNDIGNALKFVTFDATADASGRASYQAGSTEASPQPLDPTDVLRGGSYPVQRIATGPAGLTALLADTSSTDPYIDFVATTTPPTAAQNATAVSNGWGGLQVVTVGTDDLEMTADAASTNAPAGLSAQQLVQIYQCQDTRWTQVGGTSSAAIIPAIPPPGSEVRTEFLASLQTANSGTAISLGSCVVTVEENDPAGITGNSTAASVIEPFSAGRLNLWTGTSGDTALSASSGVGYFRNPAVAYPGAASSQAPGVKALTGAPSDANPAYRDALPLDIVYRDSDQDSARPWQPGSKLNWAQALFCNPGGPAPYFDTASAQADIAQAGVIPSYSCAGSAAPAQPPIQVCGNSGLLTGPAAAPAGAVTVPAGDDASFFAAELAPDTTYYFAAGTHYLGSGVYTQIQPASGDTFIGAPGAVISGDDTASGGYTQNEFAFVGTSAGVTGVTIEYLTIQGFDPPGSQGAVNSNSNDDWTIEHDTIQDVVPGAAMMIGSDNLIEDNCLTQNGEYAFNGYQSPSDPESSAVTGGPQNITMEDNEISYNDTCNWEQSTNFPITPPTGCAGQGEYNGCGCSGGGKFWQAQNVTVADNYVHNNYGAGLWADTDNDGFDIQGNYIDDNFGEGLIYEISYNALVQGNTFIDNAWGSGPDIGGFPDSAVYISESGGDSRAANSFGYRTLAISGNVFTNNWGGVVLWENSDRFCGDGSDDACTLVDPSVATLTSCPAALSNAAENQPTDTPDYFDLCRWKTQNVTVSGNVFSFNPADIGSDCTAANYCGMNGLFSEVGVTAPYTGWIVPLDISDHQGDVFTDNTYTGPWSFDGFEQGDVVGWSQWTSGFEDQNGSNDYFDGQDAGSTYNPTPSS